MKKKLFIIASIIIFILILRYEIISYRCRDIDYAVKRCMTTGIFNRYKMYKIDNYTLTFSDGCVAYIKVEGIQNNAPHSRIAYNILMEKQKNGIWARKKVYPTKYVIKGDI